MSNESKAQAKPGQYLTFFLKAQIYGVPIETVREINRMSEITVVPQTPAFMAGVMNLRGKVIPVVDLRKKFEMEFAPHTKETCIIVIETMAGQVGMIVDSVSAVIDLAATQIEPAPNLGDATKTAFVMGMGKLDEQVVILVDIVKAISFEELIGMAEKAA